MEEWRFHFPAPVRRWEGRRWASAPAPEVLPRRRQVLGAENRPLGRNEGIPGHESRTVVHSPMRAERWGIEVVTGWWPSRSSLGRAGNAWTEYGCAVRTTCSGASGVRGRDGEYMIYKHRRPGEQVSNDLPPPRGFAEPLSCALHAVERAGSRSTTDSWWRVADRVGMIAGPKQEPTNVGPSHGPASSRWPRRRADVVIKSPRTRWPGQGADRRATARSIPGEPPPVCGRPGLNLLRKLGLREYKRLR